jgi:hypothetical protein
MSLQVPMSKGDVMPRINSMSHMNSAAAIDWSTRTDQALDPPSHGRPIDLGTLSSKIGVPRAQSSRNVRRPQQSKRGSSNNLAAENNNVIDLSAKSDTAGFHQSIRMSRRDSNFGSNFGNRKRANSLDNLPEESEVNLAHVQARERKSDPLLGSRIDFGDIQENLYDEVLIDLFASAATSNGQDPQQQHHQQQRRTYMIPQKMTNSKSNESLGSMSRQTMIPRSNISNESLGSLARNAMAAPRPSQRRNSNFQTPNSAFTTQIQIKNSRSHDNLDQVFEQRRNSSPNPHRKTRSRSHDNLDLVFQQQGLNKEKKLSPLKSSQQMKEGGNMMKILQLAAEIEKAKVQYPNDQERIRNFSKQVEQLRNKRDDDRDRRSSNDLTSRRSSKLSSSGVSGVSSSDRLSNSGDEMNLFNASRRSDSGDDRRQNTIMAGSIPANIPRSNRPQQRRRSSIGRGTRKIVESTRRRRNSLVKSKMMDHQGPVPFDPDNAPASPMIAPSRRNSLGMSTGSNGDMNATTRGSDGHKLKLFDDLNAAVEPSTRLDNSDKHKDQPKLVVSRLETNALRGIDTNNQKMKLYDKLLSASNTDRKTNILNTPPQDGTASTMQTTQTHALLKDFGRRNKSSRCGRCRKKDNKFMMGLVFLLLGIIGGYLIFQFVPSLLSDGSDLQREPDAKESENDEPSVLINTDSTLPSRGTNSTVIVAPPLDIEGICSASNLPGSLSACVAACLPSACCYPGYNGESCLNENDPESEAACSSYRPYCDVFYDAWIGSTEGVLRPVSDDTVNMCTEVKNMITDEASSSASGPSPIGVKRLRGHNVQAQTGELDERLLQNNLTGPIQETCQHFCIAAKCCSAPKITNPETFGLSLSPTGVFTNTSSGEYAMTNCQASNSANIHLCTQYEVFCATDEVETDSTPITPSSPPTQVAVSSRSKSPSSKPVGSPDTFAPISKPTPISTWPAQVPVSSPTINESSPIWVSPSTSNSSISSHSPSKGSESNPLSNEPTASITGDANETTQVLLNESNETIIPSNTNLSSPNTPITILSGSLSPSPSVPPTFIQNASLEANTSSTSLIIPSAQREQIQEACAINQATFLIATGDVQARSKCIKACQDGMCCFTTQLGYDWMDSCYIGNEEVCAEYSPCLVLQEDDLNKTNDELALNESSTDESNATDVDFVDTNTTTTINSTNSSVEPTQTDNATTSNKTDILQQDGPPIPETDLSLLCSNVSITQTTGLKKCIKACDLGRCCSSDDETGCYSTHAETCRMYSPCNNAYNALYSD